jgi:hypothetical protein
MSCQIKMKGLSLYAPPQVALDSILLDLEASGDSTNAEYEEQLAAKYRLRIRQIKSEANSTVSATVTSAPVSAAVAPAESEDDKLAELRRVVGSIPLREARYWLSSNGWQVEAAVKAFFAASNSNTIQVEFEMPNGPSFVHSFEKQDLMWSCLSVVYSKLQSEKWFYLKKSQGGKELTYEEMSSTSLGSFGASYLKLWVEFSA